MAKIPKLKPNVEHRSLSDLVAALDPENPRIHSIDRDIPALGLRLLHYGWQKLPTFNIRNKLLVGGHGRVMACEWLVQQSRGWYEVQWLDFEEAIASNLLEDGLTKAKLRFEPKYWLQIPVLIVDLSDRDHPLALLGLNKSKGKDDPAKVAKLLASMNDLNAEAAGWGDQDEKDRFLANFGLLKEKIAEVNRQEEAENVQVFEGINIAEEVRDRVEFVDAAIEAQAEYIDEDDEGEPELEEEPDVEQGGSNYNPDPPKSNQIIYPLNVTLGVNQQKKYERLKKKLLVRNDITMLIKYHPAFQEAQEGDGSK